MRNFALTNQFLLTVVFLASCFTANVSDAANITVNNNSNDTLWVAIGYTENTNTDHLSTSMHIPDSTADIVRGWYEIGPHSSRTFWKGLGRFYIYILPEGGRYLGELSNTSHNYWVKSGSAFICYTREYKRRENVIKIVPYIEGTTETFDTYLWDKDSSGNFRYEYYENNGFTYTNYKNGLTRIINGLTPYNRANGRDDLQKRSISWLEDQLTSKVWSVAKFYEIPSNQDVININ